MVATRVINDFSYEELKKTINLSDKLSLVNYLIGKKKKIVDLNIFMGCLYCTAFYPYILQNNESLFINIKMLS